MAELADGDGTPALYLLWHMVCCVSLFWTYSPLFSLSNNELPVCLLCLLFRRATGRDRRCCRPAAGATFALPERIAS